MTPEVTSNLFSHLIRRSSTDRKLATETKGDNVEAISPSGDDFLARERAALGDDATQFASNNDKAVFAEDDDDDLLGGGNNDGAGEEVEEFESSYPAIDTRNEVIQAPLYHFQLSPSSNITLGRRTRRRDH